MGALASETVIVGGGVYGVALAFELAREGRQVLVLEADQLASGASGGLGKRGVRANGRDLRELPLMRLAYDLWPKLAEVLGADTGFEQTGQVRLYERAHDVGDAEVRANVQSSFGIPSFHLDRRALLDLEPGIGPQVIGGVHCPLDGVADHTATTLAYGAAARALGATILEGARVVELVREDGVVRVLRLADGTQVRVERDLILANNAGVRALLGELAPPLPVWTVLPQVVVSSACASKPFHGLIGHFHRPLALKLMDGDRVMMSGGWRGQWNETLGQGETLPASVLGNLAQAVAVFPALAGIEIEEARADRLETVCVDGVPIIDRAPGAPNVLFLTGWSGHGWALAPALAGLIAEWCLSSERPALLEPFRLDRFPSRGSGAA